MKVSRATISSTANPLIKDVRKAAQRGSRTAEGYAVAESPKLLSEALAAKLEIGAVLALESAAERLNPELQAPVRILSDAAFRAVCSTMTSQGVVALVRLPGWEAPQLFESERPIIVLDGVQDPGNAGAIVRSAEAFGAGGVIFGPGTASPFHSKTLRASAGSLFRVPFLDRAPPHRIIADCASRDFRLLAASAHVGRPIQEIDFERSAIIIGSESRGVREDFLEVAAPIRVPTERVESLNAAMAASVILYEASRQL